MQSLGIDIIESCKKEKMKRLEVELSKYVSSNQGSMIECPFCHYVGKNNKFTCKVFSDSIKCFACGIWRRILQ